MKIKTSVSATLKKIKSDLSQLKYSEFLLTITIALNIILVASAIIATSYYGLTVIGTGWDGWCDTKFTGVGTHCFGDYATMPLIGVTENPWISEYVVPWNYPAAAMLFTYVFVRVGILLQNPQSGLILYLVFLALALAAPAIWASRGKKFFLKLVAMSIVGITSIPALTTLDRGNHVGFVVPALLLFIIGMDRKSDLVTITGIVIAAMVKPQFALILLAPIILLRWKIVTWSIIGIAVTQFVPFLLWPKDFPTTIFQALSNMLAYGGVPNLSDTFPTNSSIISSIYELFALILPDDSTNQLLKYVQANQMSITIYVILIFALWAFFLRKSFPPILIAIYFCAIASTAVPVSWSYYLVFVIPVAAVILRDPSKRVEENFNFQGFLDRKEYSSPIIQVSSVVLVLTVAITLSKIVIPNIEMTMGYYPVNSGELTTVFWIFSGYISLICWTVHLLNERRR